MTGTKHFIALLAPLCALLSCRGMTDDVHYAQSDSGPTLVLSNPYPAIGESITATLSEIPSGASVTLDFGDGTTVSGSAGTHTYEDAGNYEITASISSGGTVTTVSSVVKVEILALSRALQNLHDGVDNTVWVMSHRANTENYSIPENSISAVNACIAAGADMIETDTYVTSDGQVVICHDATINRTTTGSGTIGDMDLATIKSYFLLDRSGDKTGETMPTLREFLEACRGKIYVNLDYSPRTATSAQVYEIVRDCGMIEQVTFFCEEASYVNELLALDPTVNILCSVDNGTEVISQGRAWMVRTSRNSASDVIASVKKTGGVPNCTIMDSTTGDTVESTLAAGNDTKLRGIVERGTQVLMVDYTETVLGWLRSHGYHK